MSLADFRDNINGFAKGKSWTWHVPLMLLGLYVLVKMFSFNMGGSLPNVLLVPYSFNFLVHEWAHVFTVWMPPVLTAMSGSGSELLIGLGLVLGALWLRNYFALMFCLLWLDLVLQSIGTYMADAVAMKLPLVSLGGALSGQDATHDWHFIFGELHMLGASEFIGNSLRMLGHAIGLFAVLFAIWLMHKMYITNKTQTPEPEKSWEKPPTATKPIYAEPTKGSLAYNKQPKDLSDNKNKPSQS